MTDYEYWYPTDGMTDWPPKWIVCPYCDGRGWTAFYTSNSAGTWANKIVCKQCCGLRGWWKR